MFKRIMTSLVVLLMVSCPMVFAGQVDLTFEWDPNTEPDMAKYELFQRIAGGAYDYANPKKTVNCQVQATGCLPTTVDHTITAPDGVATTYQFVAKAVDTAGMRSGDSNEVEFVADFAPIIAAKNLTAVYNDTTKTLDFTWGQDDIARVSKWILYKSLTQGGPTYDPVVEIQNVGGPVFSTSVNIDYTPGTTLYFVMVTYSKFNVYSPNTSEVKVRFVGNVYNLKVKIKQVH